MIAGLTQREHDCLMAIGRLTVDGVSPTYEQLRDDLGLASKSGVHRLVHALKHRGAITFLEDRGRSIRVLPTAIGPAELEHLTSAELRTTAAHIAGILAHREGGGHAHQVFHRIGRRVVGLPDLGADT